MNAPEGPRSASFIEGLISFIVRQRYLVGAMILAITATAVYSARRVTVLMTNRAYYYYESNPDVPRLQKYEETFGRIPGFLLLVDADDVFQSDVLAYLRRLTRKLEQVPLFTEVQSLDNVQLIHGDAEEIVAGPLYEQIPTDSKELAQVRALALASALLNRRLVSPDGRTTAIVLRLRSDDTRRDAMPAFDLLEQLIATEARPDGVKTTFTGTDAGDVTFTRAMEADQQRLVPISALVMFCILFLAFRSFIAVALPFISVFVAVIWVYGLYPYFNYPVDLIGSTVPIALLTYGAVDPVFVFSRYAHHYGEFNDKRMALVATYRDMTLPCFLTSLTTALGFITFALMSLKSMVTFGAATGIGVLFSFVTTLTVLPVLISFAPPPKKAGMALDSVFARYLPRAWGSIARNRHFVAVLALAGAGLTLWTGSRVRVFSDYVNVLPYGPVRDATLHLEESLTGLLNTAIVIEGGADAMRDPALLKNVERLEARLRQLDDVTTVFGLPDLLADANQAFFDGDPKMKRVPDSRSLVSQYLMLLAPIDRERFVSTDYASMQIIVTSKDIGTARYLEQEEKIRAIAKETLGPETPFHFTGMIAASQRGVDKLLHEMIEGYALAFAIVILSIAIFLRSARIAIVSIWPNMLPATVTFSMLVLLDVPLRLGATLVLCVCIGGLFNTTVQLAVRILRLRREMPMGHPDEIMSTAIADVMPAAMITTLNLVIAFGLFVFSNFQDLKLFGLLCAIVMTMGFLSDFFHATWLFRAVLLPKHSPAGQSERARQ